jgi:hypothetical protein
MEDIGETKFIFFILLSNKIPESFYLFDQAFKDLGFTLIPIAIDQIQILGSICQQSKIFVISSSSDINEFKSYNNSVRPSLKFLLKTERLTFFKLSSFDKLNDEKRFYLLRNYHFLNYPQNVKSVALWISHLWEIKSQENEKWPGGKRAASSMLKF